MPRIEPPDVRPVSLDDQIAIIARIGKKLADRVEELTKHNPYHPGALEEARWDLKAIRAAWATLNALTRPCHDPETNRVAREHGASHAPPQPELPLEETSGTPARGAGRDWSSGRSQGRKRDRPREKLSTWEIPEGTPTGRCRACKAAIYWIKTPAGKNMPVDPGGVSHFDTCPQAAEFKRARGGR